MPTQASQILAIHLEGRHPRSGQHVTVAIQLVPGPGDPPIAVRIAKEVCPRFQEVAVQPSFKIKTIETGIRDGPQLGDRVVQVVRLKQPGGDPEPPELRQNVPLRLPFAP